MEEITETTREERFGTPRLFIREMVLRNFKSYAGEQRVGPFHKSFSAVVGPNGSGKSNVIDAMLFVFGKRAKQMRLNKVSELIHNSTNHQNLDSAGVSVHFQEIIDLDEGTYEALPGSDFVITRIAFRDNSSKYYINDRPSNFTEVTNKLKGKGVDLDNNRFLILQGEVEQISLMKPKAQGPHDEGFLEYLEDIIGTNKYVEKIDGSYKELEALNEKRSGVVQMVKLAEKERDSLERVKNEAEAYMLKKLSLLKWQEKATKLGSEYTSAQMVGKQEKVSILDEYLKTKREEIRKCNKELKEREAFHMKLMAKVEDSSKIDDITKDCADSTNMIPQLEEDIPKLQNLLSEQEKVLEEIKENSKVEIEMFRDELANVRAELEPWRDQLIEHKGKLEVACTESRLLNEKHRAGFAAYECAQKKMNNIQSTIGTKTLGITSIQNELEKIRVDALEACKMEEDCLKEQEALIPLEQAARLKVSELSSLMESEKSQGSVLKAILQAKETNELKGICGRMGDLGAIDEKYDVAISTACPGLDYIVVETTSAAQACVEFLRRRNLGVATFMILEKQVGHLPRLKDKVSPPEGVPRLYDLIKVRDERMKLAFFAALGNTVVAQDIDQATRIAYGGNKEFRRVVTLDGSLFERSGTMSGGGSKPRGGKMGTAIRATSVSTEAIADAENELAEMIAKSSKISQNIADAVRRYQDSEFRVSRLEMELAKNQKEIYSLKTEHGYLEKHLDSLKAASEPNKDELDRLEELRKIISAEENEIDRLTQGSKQLNEKALELQNKIENAGGERLKNQKSKVTKIQTEIDKSSTEINRHKFQIRRGQEMIKKLTKGIEESKKEKEQLIGEKEKLLLTSNETTQKAVTVQETYEKMLEVIDHHKDVLDKAKTDYEEQKKTVDELRASEVDADYELQELKKDYKELEMKGRGYNKRLGDLRIDFMKHMEQIQNYLVDQEKLQAMLTEHTLAESCDLKRALEIVALLEAQFEEMNPYLESISEYRRKVSLYNGRVEDLNSVTQQRDDMKKQYDDLRKKRQVYPMITLGGDAELELVDSLDPFSEGVVFSVRPPKKSWKNIANLSGGEKTLSSLAFVFALHHYKPTPIYVMDEIDAALDFKNVSIVGHYVKDRTKDAQFIIISLRNNMFELADRLVGIYKTDYCTRSITVNPGSFAVCEKAPA
ncbi:hypothetical protein RHGRI_020310 [Rhododendron griersonianum]|uniref:Structural maintenance of chromosomes protein n=1 Tax=Rhododendron griersonianum TaxID=479676 RepID=A0AAV6JL51_9ERIC|nr:hypothetical protein RHGRI_020310 [Rhododendron griersonianum]